MKKLFYIFILIFAVIVSGCDDDTEETTGLSIVKSDVYMPAAGGEGTIEVSAPGSISATSGADWCTLSVSGSNITVTVPANEDVMGRTALVTISSLDQNVSVPVTQTGSIFSVGADKLIFPRDGGSQQVTVTANLPFDIVIQDDWLSYSVEDDLVTFTAEANTGDIPRATTFTITSGKYDALVTATQISYSDLLGNYTLAYNNGTTTTSRTVTLSEDVAGSSFILSNLPSGFSAKVLYEDGKLIMENAQYLGMYSIYYIFLCMWDTSTGSYSIDPGVQYEATLSFTESVPVYTFSDNGTWPGNTVSAFMFAAFTSETPSYSNYVGYLNDFINVSLIKVTE